MRFSVLIARLAYATLALVQLVPATPVVPAPKELAGKPDKPGITSVLTELKTNVAPPLAGIDYLVKTKTATPANIKPLVRQLTSALDTAASKLSALKPASTLKRQSNQQIAQLVAGIISDIADTLGGLLGIPELASILPDLLAGVDSSLNQVLVGLGIVLKGVLRLVANLLRNVANLLRNLAFGLTLGTLGL